MPPGPRGLALLQERRFLCGLLKEQVWGLSPNSPRDFSPDIALCCDPREFSLSRGSGGFRRDEHGAIPPLSLPALHVVGPGSPESLDAGQGGC